MNRLRIAAACVLIAACSVPPNVSARALTMAVAAEPSSMDPLFSRTQNNQQVENIFERLIARDENLQIQPGLALGWRVVDPTTWEFKLRPNVRFHDGTPFTAGDVVYSVKRASNVPNSPAPFSGAVANIASMDVLDPLTLRIHTKAPAPGFLEQIGMLFIVSRHAAEGHQSNQYVSPAVAVGTGPYKLKRWVPGDYLELVCNDDYWGPKPPFDTITVRFVANDAARMSALLSGSVDLIDNVPPVNVPRLKREPAVTLYSGASARLIYLALDSSRQQSPFVTGPDGEPLRSNPLRDLRVRQAISKMIDRSAITQYLLNGAGVPAGQIVPQGMGGYSPALAADTYDLAGAKKLLAQAGYPQGFTLTIHSSNDRFSSDGDVAQAIGQMLARGGIRIANVVTQPYNVYAGAAAKQSYSAFIFSFGNTTSDSTIALSNVMATYSRSAGTGAFNRARYSNPVLDHALAAASASFDPEQRERLLEQAAEAGFRDLGIVPLYFPENFWATRNGVTFHPNKAEYTTATYVGIR
ncbi:ABC transporter substrate-binding protein [Caballeronia mineralivorans]|jgi:peptide/nickel transport system substrate-binding protein|uniref:ABC transporter substrate-binding protein n=1 Tax=Caballeronia mineralivorans TaxID=2010198 RepID=UPI002AFF1E23|nr:ABC transporter substrate-binding protein [Caballeronia mineralivorans]MEA3099979.1 peptide/nickel transport system substrate-binding protein [Caballeronia mineralivorans]